MEDVLAKAWAQIKWEEYEANYIGKINNYSNRRSDRVDQRSNDRRAEPYPTGDRRTTRQYGEGSSDSRLYKRDYPRTSRPRAEVPEYNLSIEPVDLVAIMREMGKIIKWPRK